jgi:POT family proton-dependent oligopeptide transporter
MIIALLTYLAGQHHLPNGGARKERPVHQPLTRAERKRTLLLILVIALTVLPNIAYPMIWNIGILWIDQHASLATPFGGMPASWFNSVDSFFSIIAVPPLVALWRWQAKRRREPGDVAKIGIGAALTGASALFMVAGALLPGPDGRAAVYWPLACFAGMGIGFLFYWPVLLALISQAAPPKVNATLMGGAFLSLFVGNVTMGWVGSFYAQMDPAAFWALDAAIAFAGGLIVLLIGKRLSRALAPPVEET